MGKRRSGPITMTLTVARPVENVRNAETARPSPGARQWYRITAIAAGIAPNGQPSNAATRIDIYEEIGGWGASAAEFVQALRAVDTPEIELHVNSPGGSVFDGVAIYNSLVQHPARVTAFVDGLAASAASFIVQAADEIIMNPGSMMMVHDAIGMTWGNALDHTTMAGLLTQVSDSIADLYAARAGGTAAEWRAVMENNGGEGRWYTAAEAVSAGLADRVAGAPEGDAPPADDPSSTAVDNPVDKYQQSSIAAGHRLVLAQRDAAVIAAPPPARRVEYVHARNGAFWQQNRCGATGGQATSDDEATCPACRREIDAKQTSDGTLPIGW
jgi:ATP-dependent protease ClpP protease subunit